MRISHKSALKRIEKNLRRHYRIFDSKSSTGHIHISWYLSRYGQSMRHLDIRWTDNGLSQAVISNPRNDCHIAMFTGDINDVVDDVVQYIKDY